jgi:hypothetical protein
VLQIEICGSKLDAPDAIRISKLALTDRSSRNKALSDVHHSPQVLYSTNIKRPA